MIHFAGTLGFGDLASLAGTDSLFAGAAMDKLEQLHAELLPLSERYDVVVANPPYMGSNNMNKWLAGWTKNTYPDSKRDLCTCFIERGQNLAVGYGYEALITSDTCMYISSFEQLRKNILSRSTIVGFIDTRGTNAHPDVFDANAGWVLHNAFVKGVKGTYFKLNQAIAAKEAGYLEALANPDCGWLYRVNAETFEAAPSSPIAYWMNKRIWGAYEKGVTFADVGHPKVGMQTSNNDKYLRLWWEINRSECFSDEMPPNWVKYLKGGDYRKWYGNLDYLLHYKKDPSYILQQPHAKVLDLTYLQTPKCTWTDLTSGEPSFRYAPEDTFYDISGHCFFPDRKDQLFLLAYANSSMVAMLKKAFNSSFHFQCGDLAKIIVPFVSGEERKCIEAISCEQIELSKADWDSFESSWDFKNHPLV